MILPFSPKESENAMKKRVYTLYRVSTKGQVEKDDIPMQKEACRNFAESQGWEIVKEFSEKGVSGFKKSAKERDELQKIQQAAMEGKFDILLVFMFDRLGRRDDETPFIVEWFTKQGIEVWSVNEGQQRFDTHVDKLMNYIRYWQASGESLKTSVRIPILYCSETLFIDGRLSPHLILPLTICSFKFSYKYSNKVVLSFITLLPINVYLRLL